MTALRARRTFKILQFLFLCEFIKIKFVVERLRKSQIQPKVRLTSHVDDKI